MFSKTLAVVLVTTTAVFCLPQGPLPTVGGWNELTNAGGIFHEEINVIKSRSNEKNAILAELDDLLEQADLLDVLYARYFSKFEKETNGDSGSAENFKNALKRVASHNLEAREGLHSWTRGINQFSDLSERELQMRWAMNTTLLMEELKDMTEPSDPPPPPPGFALYKNDIGEGNVDWRSTGKVTGAKQQGNCESCTHFATAAQLETVYAVAKNIAAVDLSPQYSQDCSDIPTDHCKYGMWPDKSYDLLIKYGSAPLSQYPYVTKFQTCKTPKQNFNTKAVQYYKAWSGSESDMAYGVSNYGPMYIAINVCRPFYEYTSGIFDQKCEADIGTHSVVIVGYGTEGGKDYWLVKNSWGPGFGDNGFFKMRRNTNQSNVTMYPRILTA